MRVSYFNMNLDLDYNSKHYIQNDIINLWQHLKNNKVEFNADTHYCESCLLTTYVQPLPKNV